MSPLRRLAPVPVLALALVLSGGCTDEATPEDAADVTVEDDTLLEGGGPGARVDLVVDGVDEALAYAVDACASSEDGALDLEGSSDTGEIRVAAEGGTGTVVVSGEAEYEGRLEALTVEDDGAFTGSGTITEADDAAEPSTFELTGGCGR
jgi:hypothetical protein